ncbi:hypothetical protein B0A48_14748 [Cryoendolithus antarcticus]|uniref:DUF7918 domain-containing protein n=1 Tax=Cryoendolithus antarcticus TaxID=1507870 RepID=A0A1V8SKC4_9PEZI|nr:hypothetical protein B0A48_14748 [Cryoendolithus antarcticus]
MVSAQGIEVYIARYRNHNHRYPEYTVPIDSPVYNGNSKEVYVEALTDDRFVIIVDLTEAFDPKGCSSLEIMMSVDGTKSNPWTASATSLSTLEAEAKGVGRASLKGRYAHESVSKNVNGTVMRYGFAFGALAAGQISPLRTHYDLRLHLADESIELCKDELDEAVDTYGKIIVHIQRGSIVKAKKKQGKPRPGADHKSYDEKVEAAKDIVKDSFVSHTVRHIPCGTPDAQTILKYESSGWRAKKEALQKLKIVPASSQSQIVMIHGDSADAKLSHRSPVPYPTDLDNDDIIMIDGPGPRTPQGRKGPGVITPTSTTASSKKRKRENLEAELEAVQLKQQELDLRRQITALKSETPQVKEEHIKVEHVKQEQ